jgi:hypothetical protein
MTVAFWVNYSSLPGTFSSPVNKATGGGTDEYQYVIGDDGGGGSISLNTSSSTAQTIGICRVPLAGKVGQWLHYAYVWSVTGSFCQAYENGVLVSSQSVAIAMNPSTTHPLTFGGLGYQVESAFLGALEDIRIYNRALSGAEVNSIMTSGN